MVTNSRKQFLFKILQFIADSFIDKQMATKICSTEIVEGAILEVYTQRFSSSLFIFIFTKCSSDYQDGSESESVFFKTIFAFNLWILHINLSAKCFISGFRNPTLWLWLQFWLNCSVSFLLNAIFKYFNNKNRKCLINKSKYFVNKSKAMHNRQLSLCIVKFDTISF